MAYIGEIKTKGDLEKSTNRVLQELYNVIIKLDLKKARTLLFWLNDWAEKYLPIEESFNYESLKYYERGSILEAHFGFKVGSEQGGLHYAVVIENENDKSNRTVMVVPLGSLEEGQSENDLDKHEVYLGTDVFNPEIECLEESLKKTETNIEELKAKGLNTGKLNKKLAKEKKKLAKFKLRSIALINQMCALSKLRICSPKYDGDELSTVKLPSEKMDDIDNMIKKYFLKNN